MKTKFTTLGSRCANLAGKTSRRRAASALGIALALTGVLGEYKASAQVLLPPSTRVTADKTKPGFLWRVFANKANTVNSNARTEDALAGNLKDADGNPLPNLADPAAVGGAAGPGKKLGTADNAVVEFEVTGVINFSQTDGDSKGAFTPDLQLPGTPDTDGASDGISAEIITYLDLPAGTYTMVVNSDDGFKTTAGNLKDALLGVTLGEFNGGRGAADTKFQFKVQEAGIYPFRTTWEEGGGDANIEWSVLDSSGVPVLINDTAVTGAIKAYRAAASGAQPPYVKSISPGPGPRQLNVPSSKVEVVIADGDSVAIDDATVSLMIDGNAASKKRDGKSITLTYEPTGVQFPGESHSAELTYKGKDGTSRTEKWQFRNLKNVILPKPVVTENFDSTAEGAQPKNWVATNFTPECDAGEDITNQKSDTFRNWVVITTENMPLIDDAGINDVNPFEKLNGVPLTLDMLRSGKTLYAESDSRCNGPVGRADFVTDTTAEAWGQTQFIVSAPFDLSTVKNPVLSFGSGYMQNQDSYGGVEYSVDGGKTWKPVVYFLDGPDIVSKADGSVDGIATFNAPQGDTALWRVGGVVKGLTYGDAVAAPIDSSIGDYIVPRVNDDGKEGKRIEIFRLPAAANQADVRLRLSATGSDSWYFFIDNIAFYDVAPAAPAPALASIGLNFGAERAGAKLAATDKAGVPAVAQANWNNISNGAGTNVTGIVMNDGGAPTTVSVTFTSAGTWASTGAGEENNKFTGADKALLTGYLDTGNATLTTVNVSGIPTSLASGGYDVYVYAMGGVGGRGGAFRIVDGVTGQVIKDYVRAITPTNVTDYVEVAQNIGGTNPSGANRYGIGNYIVFKGLNSANITVQASTLAPLGTSSVPRAPINAIQIVAPSTGSPLRNVLQPGDAMVASHAEPADSPAGERVHNSIDRQVATKYLNFKKLNTGFTVTPRAGASTVSAIALTSANDAPERDPASYKLEGSNDGTTFTLISEGAVAPFTGRYIRQEIAFANTVSYKMYRVLFPTVANATAANSMQIAEVELWGTVQGPAIGATIGIAKAATGNSVVLSYTGVLQSATKVEGPYTDVVGALSPYTAAATGNNYYRTRQ